MLNSRLLLLIHHANLCAALGATNIAFDIAVTVLPFPIIAKLKMSWKKKVCSSHGYLCFQFIYTYNEQIGLGAMLALGLIITIAQIVRMTFVHRMFEQSDSAELIKWSIIEITLGVSPCYCFIYFVTIYTIRWLIRSMQVFVACIPTWAPLLMSSNDRAPSYNVNAHNRITGSNKLGAWISSKASSLGMSKNSNSYDSKNSVISHADPAHFTPNHHQKHHFDKNITATTQWSQVIELKRPDDSPV